MSSESIEISVASAMALWQAGDQFNAATQLQYLCKHDPNNGEAQHYLGVHYGLNKQFGEAQECFTAAAKQLQHSQLFYNWGNCLMEQGLWDAALSKFDLALLAPHATNFERAQSHWQIARALQQKNQTQLAKIHLQAAEPLLSEELDLWRKVAQAYEDCGEIKESLRVFELIQKRFPEQRYGYNGAGNALTRLGRSADAETAFSAGLERFPEDFVLLTNLAAACNRQGKHVKALGYSERAVRFAPLDAEVLYNHGNILDSLRRYQEALSYYESALHFKAQFAEAHFGHACDKLRLGDFLSGWRGYEWRWLQKEVRSHAEKGRLWLGQFDMVGKTLYVHVEQGFGDIIQFSRLITPLMQKGIRVIFNPPAELSGLMQSLPAGVQFHPWDEPAPAYDAHTPLVSLPLALGLTVATIPNQTPYLQAPQSVKNKWQGLMAPYTQQIKVGVAWCGNPDNPTDFFRSMSLQDVKALIQTGHAKGMLFFSLQKVIHQKDQALFDSLCETGQLIDLSTHFDSFADTAALIECLDQVISVETVIAHLAGALHRPLWIPLQYAACWRWLLEREDSPWYPSARLFRQTQAGDWAGVIERISQNLGQLAGRALL